MNLDNLETLMQERLSSKAVACTVEPQFAGGSKQGFQVEKTNFKIYVPGAPSAEQVIGNFWIIEGDVQWYSGKPLVGL